MFRHRTHHRRGLTTLMAVFILTILLIAAVLSYSVFATRDSYIELRNASQASALAGVGTLANDDLLTNDTPKILARIDAARSSAVQVAEANQLNGVFISMNPPNPTNDPAGNLVFGRLDKEIGGTFTPLFPLPAANPFPTDFASGRLNAVRVDVVHPKRPGVTVRMYAHIDHDVVGFKPTNAVNAPVIPVALLSDALGLLPKSYEAATGTDAAKYDSSPGSQLFSPGTDGIPEVKFEYGTPSLDPNAITSRVVRIGTTTVAQVQTQVAGGLTVTDVGGPPFNGQFTLAEPGPVLNVPEFTPPLTLAEFEAAFLPISGGNPAIPRVFPLYTIDPVTFEVIVTGFVAARVVSVVSDADRVTVTIQPSRLATPLAVTPSACPPPAPRFNPTLGKLRIAANVTEGP